MPCASRQFLDPVLGVERVHLQRRHVNEKTRPDELVVLVMVAQHVADILAKKTLDAFPEFLHAIDVLLRHPPRAVGRVRRARFEFLDPLFHREIPRNIRDQILQECGNAFIGSIVIG